MFCNKWKYIFAAIRDVAQPGSVHVWGAWGRKFESCRLDLDKISRIN